MRAEGEIMKKISSALLAALLLLATVFTGAPTAMAAGVSVNATTVTVYFLNQEFRKKISQPAAYPASFQLKVTGADKAAYRVTAGESATVSSTGLVEPLCTRYYWYGNVGSTAPTPGKTPDRVTESYTAGDSTVQVTASVQTLGERVFAYMATDFVLYGPATGALADYAAANNILYNHTHSFALTSTDPATCENAGSKTYTCTACSATKTETIQPLGHQPVQALYPADFQYDGSVMTYCIRCHWVLEDSRTIAHVTRVKLSATTYTYNGKVQKPSVTVKDSKGKALKNGTDYTVSYPKGMKNVGKYTVKVTLKGNYSGSKSMTYNINPKGTSVSKVKAAKKGFKVTWKKQATQTTGYQVQYSTSSKFKKAKTVTISKNKTTSKSVSKLSAKKKYYVRVRTYKTVKVNGKNVKLYSGWSKAKSVTTKK